ncbi:tripeptide aminopeptidase [Caldanaerobacter subterraneus subsp. tengcongensis MB4]|uniref:Peptidase T n=1 Tax=Caldanaerobacter subterraneus subsp. tengcongensis (strain DSM 15242 / JCM 11007 / NBRC 100824 / MB4) TaxID=273068 RepID=PEPT_CALS4|nr:peptidase T [Caldanaerobacter subterraneus]Q8R922.1 RecName: Full=Peptidase T; AltName: Full=Aminotripeptidase; Short=Tripeptidase; AltName: Full=Tripeptide aminopeptidase [Caldanaerobacter subterraneus subsp. tengcongensis MB4]AAM25000.1 Di- and tripeptidases [Caldanaerobacter subterraneus subsp. tengcongensis MB4]MCS3915417.1 tripeptide aminopeptidase [Caldanaerobacter subterraneus subsp. tengcongensis MB4]
MSKVVERFLKYVKYHTTSDENSNTFPSTEGQLIFARELAKELKELGLSEVEVDENGYVTALLSANTDKKIPTIGFIAHMDTSPDMCGKDVKPQIIENYDGNDIVLNKEKGIILSTSEFPELKNYIGKTLITTDGTTLLGADDKAGIAEIITAIEYLINHPEIEHGNVKIAFTPDEEIGRGVDKFNVKKFACDFAYTVDGGELGTIEYENFNAASAKIKIHGRNVHPGTAKGKMKNSILIGIELQNMLPELERPEHTEGYQGFYHLNNFQGTVEETSMYYIIRDFDKQAFSDKKEYIKSIVEALNKKYGEGTVELELKDQYYNMREVIEKHMHIVETAMEAMRSLGIEPKVVPIRGGTDGARLSFMGLPTPNLFTGGHNFHGKYEFIPIHAMEKAVEVIVKIVELYGKKG